METPSKAGRGSSDLPLVLMVERGRTWGEEVGPSAIYFLEVTGDPKSPLVLGVECRREGPFALSAL